MSNLFGPDAMDMDIDPALMHVDGNNTNTTVNDSGIDPTSQFQPFFGDNSGGLSLPMPIEQGNAIVAPDVISQRLQDPNLGLELKEKIIQTVFGKFLFLFFCTASLADHVLPLHRAHPALSRPCQWHVPGPNPVLEHVQA